MKTKLIQKIKEERVVQNPSYDRSLAPKDRLYDFLGAYHLVLNGVKAHEPFDLRCENQPEKMCDTDDKERLVEFVNLLISEAISQSKEELVVDENTSDGYHTFKELYEFRKIYNAVLFNEWSRQGKYNVHKSWRHNDFELCFGGGWFVVMAELPTGQISNHYEAKDWDLFHCEERDIADKWDGHSAQDVITRLLLLEDLNKK